MKPERRFARVLAALLAPLVLAGCLETKTGSNGTGGQQPQSKRSLVTGTLVGAEPFVVGASELDAAGALLRRDETLGAGSALLRLGMNVQADGTVLGAGPGIAAVVVASADTQSAARGFVRATDPAAQRFSIATLTFVVDANTLYDGVAGLPALAPGDYVEVHGLALTDLRATLATRVTRTAAPADGRISIAARIDPASAQGFSIAGIAVPGAANSAIALPQAGSRVRVSGVLDVAASAITGEQITVLPEFAPVAAARVDIEGIALDTASNGIFRLRTPARDYDVTPAAGVAPVSVTAGARVLVVGTAASATSVSAESVTGVTGQIVYRVTGVVSEFASLASLRVRGEPVDLTTAVIRGGNASEIANGRRLAIVAVAGPGALRASDATLLP
jgi:hypothetical protein